MSNSPNFIACPGCRAHVRPEAYACPSCGHRLKHTPLNSVAIWSVCVFGIAVLGALVFFILDRIRG
ncbi:MAG TPA: hypothetical protein VEI07_08700 [Planctomycetaceae bacterium]|nr:hypothetical protein [Planctomycetaceae bacterium]